MQRQNKSKTKYLVQKAKITRKTCIIYLCLLFEVGDKSRHRKIGESNILSVFFPFVFYPYLVRLHCLV